MKHNRAKCRLSTMGDDIVGTRYTCHILSGEQKVLQTQHKNQLSYGITYLVRCSSSYLLVLLCTTNKTGGGRAMYVHSKYSSSITCSNRLYIFFELHDVYQFWYCSSCVQPTRAVAGERRWASDNMYVLSNTAVSAIVSTFFRYIHMLCTTNTSVGGRAIVMYTAKQQYLQ